MFDNEVYVPLSEYLPTEFWPTALFESEDETFLDVIAYDDGLISSQADSLFANVALRVMVETVFQLPAGFAFVVGQGTVSASLLASPNGFNINIDAEILKLRLPRDLFVPVIEEDGDLNPDPDTTHFVDIVLPLSVSVNDAFDIDLTWPGEEGTVGQLALPRCMLGTSGVIISADDIIIRLSSAQPLPDVATAINLTPDWRGIFIKSAQIIFPKGLAEAVPSDLQFQNCFIGSGGFSGTVTADWSPAFSGTLFGATFGLEHLSMQFIQNAPVQSTITGMLTLPYFNQSVEVELGINLDGSLAAKLTAPGGLYTLTKPGVLSMQLQSIGFVVEQGTFIVKLSGQITPLFDTQMLNWPAFQVKELSIDSHGNVHLQGGWLNLPKQYHLNFYGFTLEIEKLGFGNTSDGGHWVGFSGGITLVSGMPAGASVDGLRLTWYDNGATQISLNGVGVEFTVPDVLHFKGAVSYVSDKQEFHGSITLNLMALQMEVDGSAVFGVRQEHTYLALYLAADWPAGIPLFATGLGLYGMAGLLVLNMAPNKLPGEEWYGSNTTPGWYLRSPVGIVQSIGLLQTSDQGAKWIDHVQATAFGVGVTLGTISDNGHAFSGRMLLVIVFPGPVLLIEGKASMLQKRAALDKDANFRALAVLDAHAGTFSVNLDAHFLYDNAGKLLNIHGGVEAFFNLNDASAWHLYLGEQDQSKRIQAHVFQLFEANTYVMLDAHQLAMGAWIGYNNQWTFGPLSVSLQAWLDSNALVSWKPAHFHGDLWLHGSVALSAFGIGLGLTVDAHLQADVFDPFHLLGQFSVSLKLPWPLPSPSASVTLEWGPMPAVPALPLPLQEVAIEHFKTTISWPLLRAPQDGSDPLLRPNYDRGDGYLVTTSTSSTPPPDPDLTKVPLVPLDSRPHLTFGRAVNDDALVGVNVQPLVPEWERIGDPAKHEGPLQVRYGLQAVELDALVNGQWTPVARKGTTPNTPSTLPTLYGSWAPVPQTPDGGGPNPGQIKLWLWSKSTFDYTRHTLGPSWNEWFKGSFSGYPCGPMMQSCWDFNHIPQAEQLPNPWHYPTEPNLVFSTDPGGEMMLFAAPGSEATQTLSFFRPPGVMAFIDLPEPVNLVRLTTLDRYGAYTFYTSFYGYDAGGNRWGPFTRPSETEDVVEIRGEKLTRIGMTTPVTLAANVSGAIGCSRAAPYRLVFVEFGDGVNPNGKISAIDLTTNTYSVLGTGYTGPEDIVVTFDGGTAYVTERAGNLLRVNLGASTVNRADAAVISSGMTAPQQIALDEAAKQAYVVEYAASGRLLRIDLGSGQQTTLFSGLNYAVGLLIPPYSPPVIAYVSEQGSGAGSGTFSQITFSDGTRTTFVSGLQSPFFMRWETYRPVSAPGTPPSITLLLTLRDPANRVVRLNLVQTPVSVSTVVDGLPFRPSSIMPFLNEQFIVCSDSVVSGYSSASSITEVCAVKADLLIQHNEEELARWSETGAVLAPYTAYRLQVSTFVQARGDGELNGYSQDIPICEYAYFRTGGPHSVATFSQPAGYPTSASPFQSGLDDLGRYVSQAAATSVSGTPGAYSIGVEFNENYVNLLYDKAQRDLVIHLYDNNGPARDPQGHLISLNNAWGNVEQLTLTESELSWLAVLSQNGCMLIDPEVILRNSKLVSPIDSQVLAPQTLYEARLVPMLLHEEFSSGSFINALGSWHAQDATGTSQWVIGKEGTAPNYSYFITQNTAASTMLLWTPNQSGDWADYRLNVYVHAASANPLGVVFRYANASQYYRFSLEPQIDPANPTQLPHWRLLKMEGGQTIISDLPFGTTSFDTAHDYLITIEALGSMVRIYQDGQLLFAVTDQALTSGSIGLYCANHPGARFTDVRVEDFRVTAPVAYKFSFTTS